MLPDKNKKIFLNEGRAVGGHLFNYGGFPKIKSMELHEESHDDHDDEEELKKASQHWYQEKLKLSKAWSDAKKTGDTKKIQAAHGAYTAHESKRPLRKKPHPHKSDYGTYHPSTNIDSSREGT
jgi:hypothetical protein